MADIATLGVRVTTSGVREAERDLKGLTAEGAKAEKRALSLGDAWGKKLGIAVLAGAGVVAVALRSVIKNTIEAEKAQAQLNAVLRSTQGAAGLTAVELNKMASALQGITTFGDEEITGAQSLLLTFTRIGKDVFPQATKSVLDISTALGQDLKSSATQVGKALNDPVQGITALTRVGVQFTEEQKKLIKGFVDLGDVSSAQGVILAELNTQFAGSAEAARNTLGGALQGLKNAFGDLLEGDSGGDGVRGTTDAINQLTDTLNSDSTKQGFRTIVEGLLSVTATAAETIAMLANLKGEIDGILTPRSEKTRDQLIAEEVRLTADLQALESGNRLTAFLRARTGSGEGISLFKGLDANAEKVRQEIGEVRAEIDRLTQSGNQAAAATEAAAQSQEKTAQAFSKSGGELIDKLTEQAAAYGLSKSALLEREKAQALANTANEEEARQIGEAYDALILKVQAEEQARGSSRGLAAATRDSAQAERERLAILREGEAALSSLTEQVRQNAADLGGPAAQSAKQYADELLGIIQVEERLRAAGLLDADAERQLALARDQAAESLKRRTEAIEAQLTPAEQLIEALQFDLKLTGLGNLAREKEIALRWAGAEATDAERAAIEALIDEQERLNQVAQAMDTVRDGVKGFLQDLRDTGNPLEALEKALDRIIERLSDQVFENLLDGLLGSRGSSGGGSAGSGLASLFGSLFGRAIGGPVSAGQLYQVGEKGMPELLTVKGKQFLIPGGDGTVTPMSSGGGERGGDIYQTIQVTGTVSRKTAYQLENEAARKLQTAGAR